MVVVFVGGGGASLFVIAAIHDGLVIVDQCNDLSWIFKMVDQGLRADYVANVDKVDHVSFYEPL